MSEQVNLGDRVPNQMGSTTPDDVKGKVASHLKHLPIGGNDLNIEELMQVDSSYTPAPIIKDTLEISEFHEGPKISSEADKPNIPNPDEEMVTGQNFQKAQEEIRTNPWFVGATFMGQYLNIVNEILIAQQQIHFKEAQNELEARSNIFALARETAQLAKALMENQAQEQMTQAIASFGNAAISATQFVQTARSAKTAEASVDKKIKEAELKLKDLEADPTHQTALQAHQVAVQQNQLNPPPKPKVIEDQEKYVAELKNPKNRYDAILTEQRNTDQQISTYGQTLQQAINGAQAAIVASIKIDSGTKEELQKTYEGLIQAMNKYSETISKHRDEAASAYSRFIDDLRKLIESDMKSHYLNPRG